MTRLTKCTLKKTSDKKGSYFVNKEINLYRCYEKRKKITSLNEKRLTENKCFWKTVKTFLSCNVKSFERMKLAEEDDTLITNKRKLQ